MLCEQVLLRMRSSFHLMAWPSELSPSGFGPLPPSMGILSHVNIQLLPEDQISFRSRSCSAFERVSALESAKHHCLTSPMMLLQTPAAFRQHQGRSGLICDFPVQCSCQLPSRQSRQGVKAPRHSEQQVSAAATAERPAPKPKAEPAAQTVGDAQVQCVGSGISAVSSFRLSYL